MKAPIPENEKQRLEELYQLHVLDTPSEQLYDDLTQLASTICQTPIAVVSLVDKDRQWFKSKVGVDAPETPRDVAFCAHAILEMEPLVIPDATADHRFKQNPLVTGDLQIRFYAGVPLTSKQGNAFGTLCVIDKKPRNLSSEQLDALKTLARQVTNVLETRLITALLHKEQQILNRFMQNLPAAAFIKSVDGQYSFMNKYLLERLGKASSDITGATDSNIHSAEIAQLFQQSDKKLIESAQVVESEEQMGEAIFHTIKFPLFDSSSKMNAIGGLAFDITAQRNTEAQLISAGKFSALGEMAAGMAHEINTPLAIINGKAKQIERMITSSHLDLRLMLQHAQKIGSTAMRIGKIVRALQFFSRESNKDPWENVSVMKIIEETLELCQARFVSHGVQLKVEWPNPALTIDCKPVQISQCLLNLLNNAHDAVESTEHKEISLQVTEKTDSVVFHIRDSGAGMGAEVRSRIFQPFFTTKPVGKGTGLGLSLSKGIAEFHGGSLTINSFSRETQFDLEIAKAHKSAMAS